MDIAKKVQKGTIEAVIEMYRSEPFGPVKVRRTNFDWEGGIYSKSEEDDLFRLQQQVEWEGLDWEKVLCRRFGEGFELIKQPMAIVQQWMKADRALVGEVKKRISEALDVMSASKVITLAKELGIDV